MIGFPTTLEDFLAPANRLRNVYLTGEKEFLQLYVRKGSKGIWLADGELRMFDNVFQIARVEARHPNKVALRRLIERVDHCSDAKLPIYIENLYNEDVAAGLQRSSLGFVRVDLYVSPAPCFLLPR